MTQASAIAQGREAFARRRWREACERLSAADRARPLEPADLERLAAAAYLVGEDAHAVATWARAHGELVDRGEVERAARLGLWLSLFMLLRGETAQATGWLARSQRLLKDREETCVEPGYAIAVTGLMAMSGGDIPQAGASFERAMATAERFGDRDLLALALLGRGQSLVQAGDVAAGVARLDEAMVAVTAGEVSPVLAGIVYCGVILVCRRIHDLRRACEWTRQLDAWCAAQPDLIPYRGQCLVHRSEVLQLQGDWPGALGEVAKARGHLGDQSNAVVGRACYQQGELHRLRGELAQAEAMYAEAARIGCEPQPGLSLLRLAEGKIDAALASIRGALAGGGSPGLLAAHVEIAIAAGDLAAARAAADELTRIAAAVDAPSLLATSAQAAGAVLLAEGKTRAGLALLREAWVIWRQLEAPYEIARARVLLGQASERLGDHETARMHFQAARSTFAELGAAPDLAVLDRLTAARTADRGGDPLDALTGREREVLSLVASGETNRAIAATLAISEHTVARHVSNIFDKLGVATRTAASAFAHKRKLV